MVSLFINQNPIKIKNALLCDSFIKPYRCFKTLILFIIKSCIKMFKKHFLALLALIKYPPSLNLCKKLHKNVF